MMITSESKGIKIEGYRGKWYVIDTTINNTIRCFLLEHETYGDEVPCLIVDDTGRIIADDVYNGFDDMPNVVYK